MASKRGSGSGEDIYGGNPTGYADKVANKGMSGVPSEGDVHGKESKNTDMPNMGVGKGGKE